ncbi:MAG: ABC transporter ATP-binding protein [Candidatus Rokubacteria bacterium RIFCSPLOWO2_02_FULL_68_19]|nr:MAG: ABC transporter ATP-binding protein [Candidatus Rokubacteria bacterium RIFCSPLOWO2_02_FULL_68_19]
MLEARDVHAGYGDVQILSGVSFAVAGGEIVALVGPNGAGKTTLLRAVMGLLPLRRGAVTWEGRPIHAAPTHRIVEQGIALVPEGRRLFARMTVEENLLLGAFAPRALQARGEGLERVFQIFPRLAERRRQLAGSLSGGEQQMVAIGRALMSRPRLLLLDEPSLGLAPRVVEGILEVLRQIHREGVGVFLVEQNVQASLALADRGYVLENGRITGQGSGRDLLRDSHVRQAYLGPLAMGR